MVLRQPDFPISLAGHATTFVAALDAIGAPWRSALGRARLPTEMANPLEWLPTHNLIRFLSDMAHREGILDLGVLVGQSNHRGAVHPAIVEAIQRAPSLYAALLAVCEHSHLQGSHIRFWLHVSHDALLLRHLGSVPAAYPGAVQAEHFRVVRLIRLIRSFLGDTWRPAWLYLTTSQTPPSLVRYAGGCTIRTGRPCGEIPVPLNLIGRPMRATRETLPEGACPATSPGEASSDWLERLKAVLASYLPSGGLTIGEMAELARMRPRTFQRLLAGRGTSYSELLNSVRFDRARQLLEDADLTVADVARLSGYTDSSNFARAFRRMSGRSPAQYRNDHLSEG